MTNNKKYQIFISYSTKNKDIKDKIVQDFTDYGFDIWVDTKNIALTKNWTEEIKKGISDSEILLYLGSSEAAKSTYVSYELGYADALNKIIFPIQIKGHKWHDCMPEWYTLTQGEELRGKSYKLKKIVFFNKVTKTISQNVINELDIQGLLRRTYKLDNILKIIRNWDWDDHFEEIEQSLIDAGITPSINRDELEKILQILAEWGLISIKRHIQKTRIEAQTSEYIEFQLSKIGNKIVDDNL